MFFRGDYVASSGKESMVKMLLDAKADVSIKNPDDFTALDLAVTPKILRMLRTARNVEVLNFYKI